MKIPFERFGSFVVCYFDSDFLLAVPLNELNSLIDDFSSSLDPLHVLNFKMAIFKGQLGSAVGINEVARFIINKLSARVGNNGWPYKYRFFGKEAIAAFDAYISAFFYTHRRVVGKKICTSIDGHVSYEFRKKGVFSNKYLLSFSENMIESVIGPSTEFFVGLSNSDFLYFGGGDVKRLYVENSSELPEEPDYHDLMFWSYSQR